MSEDHVKKLIKNLATTFGKPIRSPILRCPHECGLKYDFFFFQAEDGIRDGHVTGVQTCALPISDDEAHRPRRVALRACRSRCGGENGSSRCKMQKPAAGKFHRGPLIMRVTICASRRS